jgi:hypothetical protein
MNNYAQFLNDKECNFNPKALELGISPLHTSMRIFGFLFNLASKKDMDKTKSQARGADKQKKDDRKKELQNKIKEELGVRVEEPRGHGGTSTTGNTVRICFKNYKKFAKCLELDEEMVENFSVLIAAISSKHYLNADEFKKLADRTSEILLRDHSNIFRSVTVHKLLDHGHEYIKNSDMPLGYDSEEPAEASHKRYRYDRLHHARKDCREHTNIDVFHRACERATTSIWHPKETKKLKSSSTYLPEKLKKILLLNEGEEIENFFEVQAEDVELNLQEDD